VLAAAGEFAADKSTASGVTIDFRQVRKNGSAARIREEASNENSNRLTLTDLAVIVYVNDGNGVLSSVGMASFPNVRVPEA
jgi:hypothetical protein